MALLLLVFMTGCRKDDTANAVVGTCPAVTATDPMDKAVDVVLEKVISITFNTDMDSTTINANNISIKQGGNTIAGKFATTASAKIFTFTPAVQLTPFTVYTGNVTTGAKDTFHTAISDAYTWTFTTIPLVTVTANPAIGGTVTGGGKFAQGATTAVAALPNAGYVFVNWTENDKEVSKSPSYPFTMAGNRTLTANFAAVPAGQFAVVLSSSPMVGGANTGSGAYATGTAVTVLATPNTGYNFISWTEGGTVVSTNPSYPFVIRANRTLVANYSTTPGSQFTVALSSAPVAGGTTKGAGSYNPGASVILTATPNTGYTFVNWTENGAVLSTSATYTIVVTANRTLVANYLANVPAGPVAINLGTAGDFATLTKSGISTTGITTVTGDIGVSPSAATSITGFGLIMDTNGASSHTPIVTGKVYASDYAAPTPAKMTTAVSDMETAFTTANGLTTPAPIVGIYSGDISGRTLPAGLYKWSTGVLITNAGVTLNGGPNDVWVFQISQDLTVNNSAIITLTGGAQAKNIFWVVSGQATLGSNTDFSGIILSKTLISLNTGAKVTGRLLAQTAVTLNASTVIQP